MKKEILFFTLPILCIFFQAQAFQFTRPGNYHFVSVVRRKDSTEIYIKNYQNKKFLLYKANFPFSKYAVLGVEHEQNRDIISVDFDCDKENHNMLCTRFFNRRTSQMSIIIPYILDYNPNHNMIAYYESDKNRVVVTPLFEKCVDPLIFKIQIHTNSIFGIKTQFFLTSANFPVIDFRL